MENLDDYNSPWKRAAFEFALAIAVIVLFILIGIAAYNAVQEEIRQQQLIGGELLKKCQQVYLVEVYPYNQSSNIDRAKLEEFYSMNRECRIFNLTDLDPIFLRNVQ